MPDRLDKKYLKLMKEGTIDRQKATEGINKLLYKTLENIKLIIENEDYTDTECVEFIMLEFEDIKSHCLMTSIRKREERLEKIQKMLRIKEEKFEKIHKMLKAKEEELNKREKYLQENFKQKERLNIVP